MYMLLYFLHTVLIKVDVYHGVFAVSIMFTGMVQCVYKNRC